MRKTPERYEILRVAGLADGIFNIEMLTLLMKEHAKFQVSRATLFNTMELFCDAGLAIKHPLATAAHYEMRTDCNPKAYTICHQCNTITKVSSLWWRITQLGYNGRFLQSSNLEDITEFEFADVSTVQTLAG